jgi:hypothetical protein
MYEAVAKGHNTQGVTPDTVTLLPIQSQHCGQQCALTNESLHLSSVWTLFGRSLHVTGVISSIPENDSAAQTLQSIWLLFFLFLFLFFFP